ncbi:MAG: glycoside hydrolase family 15 protein [Peptococcaceae bacterium]|nr:glycoside hydrolase family 15 protein [Peptococcaceae bacterium]
MGRAIALGNGDMLVSIDEDLVLRDFYYPYVGMENHVGGGRCDIGIWVQGQFGWLSSDEWEKKPGYRSSTLVGNSWATNGRLGLALTIEDVVHFKRHVYLRRIVVRNLRRETREIRLIVHNDFCIGGTDIGDTAAFDPKSGGMCHFKRDFYFLINGMVQENGIFQYQVQKRFGGYGGSKYDAEDGFLEGRPIDQGSVDSSFSLKAVLEPEGEDEFWVWVVCGRSLEDVRAQDDYVKKETPAFLLEQTATYWRNWLDAKQIYRGGLTDELAAFLDLSLLITRTQIDNRGGVLGANDTDIMETNRDHYSYVWPRDGALVVYALDKAGYQEVTASFFTFCARTITGEGYFLHKYHPDGTPGSSWHPWSKDETAGLPIQEDETALVLWALWHHFRRYKNLEFVASLYETLVKPAAHFMSGYRDPETHLPLPSYDLWEERRGIFTFTTAAVSAGLAAASEIASLVGDGKSKRLWAQASAEVKEALIRYLYHEDVGRFLRGVYPDGNRLTPDYTLDASVFGVFAFGLLPPNDPRVIGTMRAVANDLWVKTEVGGVARYTNDYYFRRSDDVERVPGNPWVICTLWLAQWYIAKAVDVEDLNRGYELLQWVWRYRMTSGVLPEQIHPYTGEPLSVAPLTWSHATFCQVALDYLDKVRAQNSLPAAVVPQ